MTTKANELENRLAEQGLADKIFGELSNQRSDGKNDKKADCPFCGGNDFSYSLTKPVYRCFNCGKQGDWVEYLQKVEGLSYPEVLNRLAKLGGIDQSELKVSKEEKEQIQEKRREQDLLQTVFQFAQETLFQPEGKEVLSYLVDERGYDEANVKNMGLGACPDFGRLKQHLVDNGFGAQDLNNTGLFTAQGKSDGEIGFGITHKLIIPWHDQYNNPIGFAGRVANQEGLNKVKEAGYGKYLYPYGMQKSNYLLGIDRIHSEDSAVLVEGVLDALHLNSLDIPAIGKGDSNDLSDAQVDIVTTEFDELLLALDDDEAGDEGTKEIIHTLQESGIRTYVTTFNDYEDPDELIKAKGQDAFERQLDDPDRGLEWLARTIATGFDLDSDIGIDRAIDKAKQERQKLSIKSKRERFDDAVKPTLPIDPDRYDDEVVENEEKIIRSHTKETWIQQVSATLI